MTFKQAFKIANARADIAEVECIFDVYRSNSAYFDYEWDTLDIHLPRRLKLKSTDEYRMRHIFSKHGIPYNTDNAKLFIVFHEFGHIDDLWQNYDFDFELFYERHKCEDEIKQKKSAKAFTNVKLQTFAINICGWSGFVSLIRDIIHSNLPSERYATRYAIRHLKDYLTEVENK